MVRRPLCPDLLGDANGEQTMTGPISSVTILGQTIIMVNDRQMSIDLMETRSSINSSRPRMTFAGEMCVDTMTVAQVKTPG